MWAKRARKVLDFEGSWWPVHGPKDQRIREYRERSATRYYQVLRRIIDEEGAFDHDPLTILRLRRMRRQRLDQIADRVGGAPKT